MLILAFEANSATPPKLHFFHILELYALWLMRQASMIWGVQIPKSGGEADPVIWWKEHIRFSTQYRGNDGRRILKNSEEWDGAGAISACDGKHNLQ